jgi:uncharacterized membrane protein
MNWKEFFKSNIKSIVIAILLTFVLGWIFIGYNILGFTGITMESGTGIYGFGFPFVFLYEYQGKSFFLGIPSYLVLILDFFVWFIITKFLFFAYYKLAKKEKK